MSKISIADLKTFIKNEVDSHIHFPGLIDHINKIDFTKIKPLLNISLFKPSQKDINIPSQDINSEEIFNISFTYENEYISKPFSFCTAKPLNKIFFLSNFYKIFILNVPSTIQMTIFDFYSLIILLCPDFPKTIIKKLTILTSGFGNTSLTPAQFNENNKELKMKINTIEMFCMFSIYFIYNEFFFEIDKMYVNANSSSITVKELKKLKGLKKELLYQIIILSVPSLLEEYNLNTINTIEDMEEIIEKGGDNKIAYCMINEKALKNYSLIYDITNIDLQTYEFNDVLSGLCFE